MSHFTVLVIGNDVEKQLQPFHEFECTGTDDEYVQEIDKTDEDRAEFVEATRNMIRLADGTLVAACDDVCYRDPTEEETKTIGSLAGTGASKGLSWHSKDWGDGLGYRTKVRFTPEGAEKVEVPHDSFADYLKYSHHYGFIVPFGEQPDLADKHKYGYALLGADGDVVKVIHRTNPNRKWDWWAVGGRWAGLLKLKSVNATHGRGRPRVMGSRFADGEDRCDQAMKKDIDWEGMRDQAAAKASAKWEKVRAIIDPHIEEFVSWPAMREKFPGQIDAARKSFREQPLQMALMEARKSDDDLFMIDVDEFIVPKDVYVQRARDAAGVTFAVLKDGQWYERGEMGWWGIVTDEKARDDWNGEFQKLIDGLPDDTLLTVVDCHI